MQLALVGWRHRCGALDDFGHGGGQVAVALFELGETCCFDTLYLPTRGDERQRHERDHRVRRGRRDLSTRHRACGKCGTNPDDDRCHHHSGAEPREKRHGEQHHGHRHQQSRPATGGQEPSAGEPQPEPDGPRTRGHPDDPRQQPEDAYHRIDEGSPALARRRDRSRATVLANQRRRDVVWACNIVR